MQRDDFSFSREYPAYELIDERHSEQYVYGKILDNPTPGAFM